MLVSSIGKSDFCVSNTELDSYANMVVVQNQEFYLATVANIPMYEHLLRNFKHYLRYLLWMRLYHIIARIQGRHTCWWLGILFVFHQWIIIWCHHFFYEMMV